MSETTTPIDFDIDRYMRASKRRAFTAAATDGRSPVAAASAV